MEIPTFVISDPPHGEVDIEALSEAFHLDPEQTGLKVAFPAPEVLTATERDNAVEFAVAMREIGLHVVVVDGVELGKIPWPHPARWVRFDADALVADTAEGEVRVPYDTEVVGIYCKPPEAFDVGDIPRLSSATSGPDIAEAIQWLANLDLYYEEGGEPRRLSLVRGLLDFAPLGPLQGETRSDSMEAIMAECGRRFERFHLDDRLQDVRPRQRFIAGEVGFDHDLRKRYSYGTLLLCHVLASVDPELRNIHHFELGSRLGYLVTARRAGIR